MNVGHKLINASIIDHLIMQVMYPIVDFWLADGQFISKKPHIPEYTYQPSSKFKKKSFLIIIGKFLIWHRLRMGRIPNVDEIQSQSVSFWSIGLFKVVYVHMK